MFYKIYNKIELHLIKSKFFTVDLIYTYIQFKFSNYTIINAPTETTFLYPVTTTSLTNQLVGQFYLVLR